MIRVSIAFIQFIFSEALDVNNEVGIDLKCSNNKLNKAKINYENCLQKNTKVYAEANNQDTEIKNESLCKSLEQFINNCTTEHLGNCYPEKHINAIIQEQKLIAR